MGSTLTLDGGIEVISRADLLSLRSPKTRAALLARFQALRKAMREMGLDPELLDYMEWKGRKLAMVEKSYVMLLVYCGLSHGDALSALLRTCGVELGEAEVRRKAGYIQRAVESTFIPPALKLLLRDSEWAMDFSPERTLEELYKIATGSILDVAEWSGNTVTLRDSRQMPRAIAAQISAVKPVVGRDGTVSIEIKLHDKVKSLELLMKHFGLLTEKVEVTVDQSLSDRLEKARNRVFEGEVVPAGLLEQGTDS